MAKEAYRSRPLKILLRSYIMASFSSFRLSFCHKHVIYNHYRLLTNDKEITIWPSCELESLLNEFAKLTMTAVSRGITCVLRRCGAQTTRPVKVIHSVWDWNWSGRSILKVTTLQKKQKTGIRNNAAPVGSFHTTEIFKYGWTLHLSVTVYVSGRLFSWMNCLVFKETV